MTAVTTELQLLYIWPPASICVSPLLRCPLQKLAQLPYGVSRLNYTTVHASIVQQISVSTYIQVSQHGQVSIPRPSTARKKIKLYSRKRRITPAISLSTSVKLASLRAISIYTSPCTETAPRASVVPSPRFTRCQSAGLCPREKTSSTSSSLVMEERGGCENGVKLMRSLLERQNWQTYISKLLLPSCKCHDVALNVVLV